MITDITTDSKFAPQQHAGCFRSWKGIWNCTNYGVFMWIIDETRRLNYAPGYKFIRQHIIHMTEYGFDWGNSSDWKFHHKPGGEGVGDHPVWETNPLDETKTNNWDSDINRHVHLEPYAYCLRLMKNDASFASKVGLSANQHQRLSDMAVDWADNWYLKTKWLIDRNKGILFQYGRSMVPARGLMEMYYLTNKPKYLMGAEFIFMSTFWGMARRVNDRNGVPSFWAYDTGYEGEILPGQTKPRYQRLLYYAAHFNMEPWQMGFVGDVAARVYAASTNALVKQLCREVITDISDWVIHQSRIPLGDATEKGSKDFILSFLQGGNLVQPLNTINNPMMSPSVALNLDPKVPFLPLSILRSHLWDGGYWNTTLPNDQERVHYPKSLGPNLAHPNLYNWADIMMARYFLSGKKTHLLWAIWIYRDAKYFHNRSSVVDFRTLDKPDMIQYGGGNTGKTRGFAEWARGAMWSRPAIEYFDKQLQRQ
jgi:hypothetical protein